MLQDVRDLRKMKWVPRREDNNPKTIDQIHKEAADAAKKTQLLIQQSKQMQKRDRGDRGDRGRGEPTTCRHDGFRSDHSLLLVDHLPIL